MSIPTTRDEFKAFCLRRLGDGVIDINVSPEQIDDCVDIALSYAHDYHFDLSDKTYYKYQVTGRERTSAANTVVVNDGGTGYSNTDTITFSHGSGAELKLETYANGTISSVMVDDGGRGYSNDSVATIDTSTGSGADLSLIVGDGSIAMPENIIGAVSVFRIGDPSVRSDDMFNIRYQIALNDLYNLTNVTLVPYYMVMKHLALITELLVPEAFIRFSRHRNKLYLDMDWQNVFKGEYLIIEAHEVVDPNEYQDVWKDRWLQQYCSAKIQEVWGKNLTKFVGMALPGGVQFNGERILQDAQDEIKRLEDEMLMAFSLPPSDYVG